VVREGGRQWCVADGALPTCKERRRSPLVLLMVRGATCRPLMGMLLLSTVSGFGGCRRDNFW
jgi:hypothetical protein